jgi:hypothetical protein
MKKIILGIMFFLVISSASAICPCMKDSKIESLEEKIDSSLKTSAEIEQQIENRGFLIKIFFGSDWTLAEKLKNETSANRKRINELKNLGSSCMDFEKENERLYTISVMQGNMRGLFGWFKR